MSCAPQGGNFAASLARKAAINPPNRVLVTPVPLQQQPQGTTVTQVLMEGDNSNSAVPPWANRFCTACQGKGFNTAGNPCRICAGVAKQNGFPTPDQFEIAGVGGGFIAWAKKDGTDSGQVASPSAAQPVRSDERQETQAPQQSQQEQQPVQIAKPQGPVVGYQEPAQPVQRSLPPQQEQQPVQEQEQQEEGDGSSSVEADAEDAAQQPQEGFVPESDQPRKAGRPKKGFTLLINSHVERVNGRQPNNRHVKYLDDVLRDNAQRITDQHYPGQSYYAVDPALRTSLWPQYAAAIAETMGVEYVVVEGIGRDQSDLRAVMEAIRPYASAVIVGQ